QRIINHKRIPEITNYILNKYDDYVFSSLTASIDGDTKFTPILDQSPYQNIGTLTISLEARFLINECDHIRAAIEKSRKIHPALGDETISVVFFLDTGLKKAQQMFADLNRHAVNTTTSLGILYDFRDQLSLLTKSITHTVPFLRRYTDKEKVSLSKNSPKIIALNHIYNTNLTLLDVSKGDPISSNDRAFAKEFWTVLTESISEWNQVMNKELTPKELRINFVIGHGVLFEALGI